MTTRFRFLATVLCPIALVVTPVRANGPLDDLKARMDASALKFQAMTASVLYVTHIDVLDDNSKETGSVMMRKVKPGDVQGRIDFETPDKKFVTIADRRVQIYLPKMNTLQIFDLGKHGDKLDQFIMIGFGTSGTDLAKDYTMSITGQETLKGGQGVATIRLELVPKAGEAREYVKKLELWIPETGDPYPRQEKISQPSGDYRLVTYNDLKINPPLKPDALQLKLPPGVKVENVGH